MAPSCRLRGASPARIEALFAQWNPGPLMNPDQVPQVDPQVAAFLRRLAAGAPPAQAAPLLVAVWHGLRGDWDRAHAIAQDDTSAQGAWVHAWLHRIEGDTQNARYWYTRARRDVASGDLAAEGRTIAAVLLKATPS